MLLGGVTQFEFEDRQEAFQSLEIIDSRPLRPSSDSSSARNLNEQQLDTKGQYSDQQMINLLVDERVKNNSPGQATFAVGRDGNGEVTNVKQSIPGGTREDYIHAEPQVLKELEGRPKPHTVAVDQVPCKNCAPELIKSDVDKVIVPSKASNPTGSPKSAAIHAADRGVEVIPREVRLNQ